MTSVFFKVPAPLAQFFSHFPLHTYPSIAPLFKRTVTSPTLWIHPPIPQPPSPSDIPNLLSADVECLKWQAYLALRGLTSVHVRFDVHPEGGIDGRLPNLQVPWSESLETEKVKQMLDGVEDGELLAAHLIPTWVDANLDVYSEADTLEGYKNELARDESRAWVALLEGVVHSALIISKPPPSYLHSLLFPTPPPPTKGVASLDTILSPPPAPLNGFSSLLPSFGTRVSKPIILVKYKEAIASLSERLGTDKWFLNSDEPTPLDALAFAYLHCLLHAHEEVRIEVTRRVNLVAWEWRVRSQVRSAFTQ